MLRRTLKSERYKEKTTNEFVQLAQIEQIFNAAEKSRKAFECDSARNQKEHRIIEERGKEKTKRHTTPKTKASHLTHVSNNMRQ